MNFLEELIAEWYQYQAYFTKTSVKFEKLPSAPEVLGLAPFSSGAFFCP
jgi:hypothetical protein